MPGRQGLPGGEPRKASQRKMRRAPRDSARITMTWRPGDTVRWKGRTGIYARDVGDGEHSEIRLESRVYQVPTKDLA